MTAVDIEIDMSVLEDMDFSAGCTGFLGETCSNTAKWIVSKNICPCINLFCDECLKRQKEYFLSIIYPSSRLHCFHCKVSAATVDVVYHYEPLAN